MKWGRLKVDMQWNFAALFREGMSCTEIAKTLGIGRRTAQMWVLECGYLPRPVGRPRKKKKGKK